MKNLIGKVSLFLLALLLVACGSSSPSSSGSSANTNLEDLVLSEGVTLTQAFQRGTAVFNAVAPNNVSTVTVTPFLQDNAAKVTVNDIAVESGTPSIAIPLDVGETSISITVIAQDGATSKTYSLVITRLASDNANLAGLSMSPGSLDQTFTSSVTKYSATVPFSVDTFSLTATTESNDATMTIQDTAVTSGLPSTLIPLAVGSNNIFNIVVTAQDGTTQKTYSLAVTRLSAAATTSNANLSGLALSMGSLSPVFDGNTLVYSATVANAIDQLTVTPTVEDSGATVTVNGTSVVPGQPSQVIDLLLGANTLNITVLASDGITQKSYAVTVIRQYPNDASLGYLALSFGSLSPAFNSGITNYVATVENNVATLTVTPVATDSGATIEVTKGSTTTSVASGTTTTPITLDVGANTITVKVTAQDNSTIKTYSVVVNRQGGGNVDMLSLGPSHGLLNPGFASNITDYALVVGSNISSITFSPTLADGASSVKINGVPVVSSATSEPFSLLGTTDFYMVVTSGDGLSQKTYKVEVSREGTESVDLAGLSLSTGNLSMVPEFSRGTLDYTAQVAFNATTLTVTPTLVSATSTVTVAGAAVNPGNASQDIALNVGDNVIPIVVTAEGGALKRTYTLTVIRQGNGDAGLNSLSLSAGGLTPVFDTLNVDYALTVSSTVTSTIITPSANDANAVVTVNGVEVPGGSASNPIALPIGSTDVNVVVTAQDNSTIKTYHVAINRPSPDNANLSSLVLSQGSLSPAFNPSEVAYIVDVASEVSSVTVTADTEAPDATMTVAGASTTPGTASASFPLIVGSNVMDIIVTAEDGSTTKLYQVEVRRAASSDARLTDLTLNTGTLVPVFSSAINSYDVAVANNVTNIDVTPTANHPAATITVGGAGVTSGSAKNIALTTGTNVVTVQVTAEDGTTVNTYTVNVTRALNSDNDLSGLSVSSGTLSPVFDPATLSYNVDVSNATASVTITPTVSTATTTITVDGTSVTSGSASGIINVSVGDNPINVVVTAENLSSKTYTVNFHRLSNNADLSGLAVSNLSGALSPGFDAATTSYTADVSSSVNTVAVTPTAADSSASIKVNTVAVTSGSASGDISLSVGDNAISVEVTAEDGTIKTYNVTVHKLSGDATLSALLVSGVSMSDFTAASLTYNKSVGYVVGSVAVTPTANDSLATITVDGASVSSGGTSADIALTPTVTKAINIVVTAEDTSVTNTYTVNVTRDAVSTDATLSALSLSDGTLSPTFAASTYAYSASVANAVSSITITATANNAYYSGLTIDTVSETSGVASGAIALNVGDNLIDVAVTAEDGVTTEIYTITVNRAALIKTVCASGCNYSSIQAAINGVAADTTIQVADGSYAEAITIGSKNVIVTSVNGAASTTLTGDGTDTAVVTFNGADASILDGFTISNSKTGSTSSRAIYVTGSATPTISNAILSGNSLVGGSLTNGGAGVKLAANTGTTTLDNVTIQNNTTKYGAGGILVDGSSLSITGTTHIDTNNVTQGPGGAIYVYNGGSLSINASGASTSTISGNTAYGNAPGIYFNGSSGGTLSIANIAIDSNTTSVGYAGGLYLVNIATDTVISNTTISNNTAKFGGGGIYADGASIDLRYVTIDGNTLTQSGGAGLHLINGSSAIIDNSSITNNVTNGSGVGMQMDGASTGTLSISNSTIDGNAVGSPAGYGGGLNLLNIAGTVNITNTSISNNKNKFGGGGIYASGTTLNITGSTLSGNTLTQGAGAGIWTDTVATIAGTVMNDNVATGSGGALSTSADLTMDSSFIGGNKTNIYGGGIYASGNVDITNTVINGNVSTKTACCGADGGGIYLAGTTTTHNLTNVTVVGNNAYDKAGIVAGGGTTNVKNSILYSNSAYQTGDTVDDQFGGPGAMTLDYSVIQNGWAGSGTGNQTSQPTFVDEQVATGTTPTSAGDFRLCVDTNSPDALCPDTGASYPSSGIDMVPAASNPQSVDVLNYLRASDVPGVGNDSADYYDAGAYEYQYGLDNFTNVETMTAIQDTDSSISISVPYIGDGNGDNTFDVDYKLSADTAWTNWVTNSSLPSPVSSTIYGLTVGASYDVRVTFNDADGVGGSNPQIAYAVVADADLTALSSTSGALSPTFDASTTSYDAGTVLNAVTSVEITATLSDSNATMTIGGTAATSGAATIIPLSVGANNIDVVVTAANSTVTKTYTVTVTRSP